MQHHGASHVQQVSKIAEADYSLITDAAKLNAATAVLEMVVATEDPDLREAIGMLRRKAIEYMGRVEQICD